MKPGRRGFLPAWTCSSVIIVVVVVVVVVVVAIRTEFYCWFVNAKT